MSEVRFLLGSAEGETLEGALARMAALPAWQPFDPRATRFIARFSQRLLTDRASHPYPELLALGHWFRGARLRELEAGWQPPHGSGIRLGRGLAFHLAPANVDSVFMYSWLLSALAGNVNVVRLSQKASPQVDLLVGVLRATLEEGAGRPLAGRFLLLTYTHSPAITETISRAAMTRVVWGGDATVATIRAIPLRPTASELVFPDRFSAAAFRAAAVLAASDTALAQLAAAFYNDAFWFAQQACSSPRMLAWVGAGAEIGPARGRFWAAVEAELQRRAPENTAAMAMARVVTTFEYAARGTIAPGATHEPARFPQTLALQRPLDAEGRDLHCGNGLFLEQSLECLDALAAQLSDKEQTLTVFGFGREELAALVGRLPPRAVDRIVPVGQALTFDTVWDGVDLLAAFSRQVSLPPT